MHCEFCDITLDDLASARRHMLSIAHVRNRRYHDLSTVKVIDKLKQATIHPKDFYELTKLINIYSKEDVIALKNMDFFKLTKSSAKISKELIKILYESSNNFHLNSLPDELRQPFIQALERPN